VNICFSCSQRVLDHDKLSRNDMLGSVLFTTAELEMIAADFQVSLSVYHSLSLSLSLSLSVNTVVVGTMALDVRCQLTSSLTFTVLTTVISFHNITELNIGLILLSLSVVGYF